MREFSRRSASPPRRHSPGRVQRRRLAIDLGLALIVALVFLIIAGGLGVVAWFGIPILLIGLLTLVIERGLERRRARARTAGVRATPIGR